MSDDTQRIRNLAAADIPAALRLSAQAGWNQTPQDWGRMLALAPQGCFVAELRQTVIGTTVCCDFGPVAWLAMVLVDESLRGRGIGRSLVDAGLRHAADCGAKSVRLDATPLGRPVYERLGFRPQFELDRWGGVVACDMAPVAGTFSALAPTGSDFLDQVFQLDWLATGADRSKLLQDLFQTSAPRAAVSPNGDVAGFLTRRPGRAATQIGPCAGILSAACWLLRHELQAANGTRVIIDLPSDAKELASLAKQAGLAIQRPLLRMIWGEPLLEDRRWFQISSGAELG